MVFGRPVRRVRCREGGKCVNRRYKRMLSFVSSRTRLVLLYRLMR